MTASCDTCPNASNAPLVVWGNVYRCYRCASVAGEFAEPDAAFVYADGWYTNRIQEDTRAHGGI